MVLEGLIASEIVSGLLEIVIPIAIGVYIARKLGGRYIVFVIGGILFIVSLIRLPLNDYLSQWVGINFTGQAAILLALAFPSLTAGVFEEGFRYIGLRYAVKDRGVEAGVMYGAGHGGFESIFLVGGSVLSTAIVIWLNPGIIPSSQLAALEATPIWLPLVGVYERVVALSFHIGMGVLVLRSITQGRPLYVGAAIATHFMFNFIALYATLYGVFASEAVATVFGVAALYYAYTEVRKEFPGEGRKYGRLPAATG
jgi:uncharacterized membrane protein YhfC